MYVDIHGTTPCCSRVSCIITMSNVKGKILSERKTAYYKKRTHIRPSVDFSAVILQARRKWHDVFEVLHGKDFQSSILYLIKLSFRT